jgi:TPR repeat protein
MGTLHLQGAYGVEQNYELAREYFALAAEQGDLGGLTNMGFLYAKVPHLPPSARATFFFFFAPIFL